MSKGQYSVPQLATILGCSEDFVRWAVAERHLEIQPGSGTDPQITPFAAEGFRRRLEAGLERMDSLDPRELERVRWAMRDGAQRRAQATAEGRPYSTHPTVPPPAGAFHVTDEDRIAARFRSEQT